MHVAELWRYPVKSLRGERLERAEITCDGIAGDRLIHVARGRGPLTGRTRHGLLTIPASTGPDGVPLVAGHPWSSPEALAIVQAHAGPDARLVPYAGYERFDVLNLLVATDGAVARFGHDSRRLRPNVLLAGVDGNDEVTWPRRAIAIGDVLIGVHSVRERCIVTTIDPDTGERDLDVLRHINTDFGGKLALNCWVIRPGTIHAGDRAEIVDSDARPSTLGGWIVGAPYLAA